MQESSIELSASWKFARPSRSIRTTAFIGLAAFLAVGCPHPLRFGPEGAITDPELLLRKIDEQSGRALSVKAEARTRIKSPQQSGKVDQLIAAQSPAQLHVETLGFFGKPVSVMASNNGQFQLFFVETGEFLTGRASARNLSRVLPIDIDPAEAVMLLLGDAPLLRPTSPQDLRMEIDSSARAYLLTISSGPATQRLWVDTESLRPLRSEIRGIASHDVQFGKYKTIKEIPFPLKIEVKAVAPDGTKTGTEIAVEYKDDLELNTQIDPELFSLSPPPNSRQVDLGD